MGALRRRCSGATPSCACAERIEAAPETGRARRIVIVAPPGVGKSRLLAELGRQRLGRRRCFEARVRRRHGAYETVAQLLRRARPRRPSRRRLAEEGVAPGAGRGDRAEVAQLVDPRSSRRRVRRPRGRARRRFAAWMTALDALGGGSPVWLIEDVHWAGGDLLAFLDVRGARRRAGRLIVATARPACSRARPTGRAERASTSRRSRRPTPRRWSARWSATRCRTSWCRRGGAVGRHAALHRGAAADMGERRHAGARADGAWRLAVQPEAVPCRRRCRPSTPRSSTTCRRMLGRWRAAGRSPAAACRSRRFASLELDGRRGRARRPARRASWRGRSPTR